jgi:hypothetical protein
MYLQFCEANRISRIFNGLPPRAFAAAAGLAGFGFGWLPKALFFP